MMRKLQVLLLEDNVVLALSIKKVLANDFEILCTDDPNEAIKEALTNNPCLTLLDIILNHKSQKTGLDVCKTIKQAKPHMPTIMLTGKTSINYKLGAFKYGADDYICKPFNLLELRARIYAVLQRYNYKDTNSTESIYIYKDLIYNKNSETVQRAGNVLDLRKKEREILEIFIRNVGKVLTRESILTCIWNDYDNIESNTVDVHIKNLREKIDKEFSEKLIKTVYAVGYKFE